jgi:hypothetical protein
MGVETKSQIKILVEPVALLLEDLRFCVTKCLELCFYYDLRL